MIEWPVQIVTAIGSYHPQFYEVTSVQFIVFPIFLYFTRLLLFSTFELLFLSNSILLVVSYLLFSKLDFGRHDFRDLFCSGRLVTKKPAYLAPKY